MNITIDLLRKLCINNRTLFTTHSLERFHERGILREDIINVIMTGEIIEYYPNDYPLPSCLILGVSNNKHLHVVCGCDGETVYIITAYYPSVVNFENDLKTRKENRK